MNFHYCGNPAHDIIYNTLVVLNVFPEWVPLLGVLKRRLYVVLLRRVPRH